MDVNIEFIVAVFKCHFQVTSYAKVNLKIRWLREISEWFKAYLKKI